MNRISPNHLAARPRAWAGMRSMIVGGLLLLGVGQLACSRPPEPPAAPPDASGPEPDPGGEPEPEPGPPRPPNIVFILTDDLSMNLVQYMPNVMKMQRDGATFSNYFVTDSLCCPSRATILTGRYPHNTGVLRNIGPDGGYRAFRRNDNEGVTFAAALSAAGYGTAMLGKYMNGYQPSRDPVPPGWTSWSVGGNAYRNYDYELNQDGTVVAYGDAPEDYLTDVLSARAAAFVRQSAGKPFVVKVAPFTPHTPSTTPPRDADAFPGLRAPRDPAFNAAPDADAPLWLRGLPPLDDEQLQHIDEAFRKRVQSVLSIDKMIGDLQAAVADIGQADNTYFVFSSDNGYHMGEHRLSPGKMPAYDTDIHVPLVITGPGITPGKVIAEIAENTDLCATFAELAGVAPPATADGVSLVPLLHGKTVPEWRTVAFIEHHGRDRTEGQEPDPDIEPRDINPPTYRALRAVDWVYVEYDTGEKQYHDLRTDPHELRNTFAALPQEERRALHDTLERLARCKGKADCQEAARH